MYHKEKWGFHNTPAYIPLSPDFLLIGVIHGSSQEKIYRKEKRSIIRKKKKEFKKKLKSLDHLAFEGYERVFKLVKADVYELIAWRYFKGKKHFLDTDSNYAVILEQHGVPTDLLGLYRVIEGIRLVLPDSEGFDEFLAYMSEFLQLGQQLYPGFNQVNITRIMESLPILMIKLLEDEELFDACIDASNTFSYYLGRVRDHIIYAPKIRSMQTDLKGRKGALLGVEHIEYIKGLLTGEIDEKCVRWQEYVPELDENARRGVRFLEEFAIRYLDTEPIISLKKL